MGSENVAGFSARRESYSRRETVTGATSAMAASGGDAGPFTNRRHADMLKP
jgi:hypothetical protein